MSLAKALAVLNAVRRRTPRAAVVAAISPMTIASRKRPL